ncbi:LolA family protein [Streptosporangium saharense]|uniref:LolA family protein n=1 Tax=Streptosporangium saharense TaxID=1706840 RepID=UPI003430B915
MSERTGRSRVTRWGVPVAAIAVVAAAVGAGPVIAAVQGEPALPTRTAQQLLADAARAGQSGGVKPMSGTVIQTASLGLPGLPDVAGVGGSSPAALLAGSHELKVWYGGADRLRLALPGRMSETDLIVNGDQVWLWQSETNEATRIKGVDRGTESKHASALPSATTPQQAAQEVLSRAATDTVVSVSNTERVADRPAYQLVLAPKDSASLVKEVRLALDGETFVPLRVQVYAKSAAEPAFEVGFTSVTFTPPAAENFTFTPPAGAKVTERTADELGEQDRARKEQQQELKGNLKVVGQGWTSVAVLPFSVKDLGANASQNANGEGQDAGALATALLGSAKQVSGPWGSGRVIQTKLLSALLTDDGRLLVGAVTPERLQEAAARG